jgi:hypothetical protein
MFRCTEHEGRALDRQFVEIGGGFKSPLAFRQPGIMGGKIRRAAVIERKRIDGNAADFVSCNKNLAASA